MVLSDAEKKRRSRARKSDKYHARERETSRKRMAVYRAKNKAQKRAQQLKSLLSEGDVKEIEAHVIKQKQHLLCDWFNYHNLKFDPKMINKTKVLNSFMTKVELHKIELQVAEFEISIIEDRDDCGNNNVEFVSGLEPVGFRGNLTAESTEVRLPNAQVYDHHGPDQVVLTNDEIDHFVKKEIASKRVEENAVTDPTKARRFTAPSVAQISRENSMSDQINAQGFMAASATPIIRENSMVDPTNAKGFMAASVTPISKEIARTRKLAEENSMIDFAHTQGFMAPSATPISRENSMSEPNNAHGFMAPSADPISVPADESKMIDLTNAQEIGLNNGASDMAPSLAVVKFEQQNSAPHEDQSTDPAASATPSVQAFDSGMDEVLEAEKAALLQMDLQDFGIESTDPAAHAPPSVQAFDSGVDEVLEAEKAELLHMDMHDFGIENGLEINAECFGADAYLW
eukprot:CAMPEP_0172554188 /NCGR_PEP_ID=MMETSP1067-20121228/53581_1 /TAXON_ID=265564 ORGANISM="Thalassiosira punctigera, Strain Tpunct2005C2" /NCGR_SAMPLE_ID=MMETSP1067 /ASSEMBLY_ACC=CAM_ASM_000444 /LENGTH=457 /DNA_ID=CAMNT_0013342513 /DNA_START=240 /DNA_END=1610 /DNA_ORIENTATION=-